MDRSDLLDMISNHIEGGARKKRKAKKSTGGLEQYRKYVRPFRGYGVSNAKLKQLYQTRDTKKGKDMYKALLAKVKKLKKVKKVKFTKKGGGWVDSDEYDSDEYDLNEFMGSGLVGGAKRKRKTRTKKSGGESLTPRALKLLIQLGRAARATIEKIIKEEVTAQAIGGVNLSEAWRYFLLQEELNAREQKTVFTPQMRKDALNRFKSEVLDEPRPYLSEREYMDYELGKTLYGHGRQMVSLQLKDKAEDKQKEYKNFEHDLKTLYRQQDEEAKPKKAKKTKAVKTTLGDIPQELVEAITREQIAFGSRK